MAKDLFEKIRELSFCDEENITAAQNYYKRCKCSEVKALLVQNCGDKEELLKISSKFYQMKVIRSISSLNFDTELISLFQKEDLYKYKFIPYKSATALNVFLIEPKNALEIQDFVHRTLPDVEEIEFYIIFEGDFEAWISSVDEQHVITNTNIFDDLTSLAIEEQPDESEEDNNYDPSLNELYSTISLVNNLIADAYQKSASDIHIEPSDKAIRIRFRIDGMLITQAELQKSLHKQIINRIKVMSNLDVTKSRMPQSGKLRLNFQKKPIDLRVSTLPTIYGEKITMRILEGANAKESVLDLGFSDKVSKKLTKITQTPHGIVLVTGPTGSGKTTTLAAMINELNIEDRNIVTIEDPVEFRIEGVTQINTNTAIGLNFNTVLREVLRQDPDIIMIGEIRDTETAKIATQASNTGHLVLATLHTNSACSAAVRLTEMGVEPFMVGGTMRGILNQRLLRKLCPRCKESYQIAEHEVFPNGSDKEITLYQAKGCQECNNTGYRGRVVIAEFLSFSHKIKQKILANASIEDLKETAKAEGMAFLLDYGIDVVKQGLSSFEELNRVVLIGDGGD